MTCERYQTYSPLCLSALTVFVYVVFSRDSLKIRVIVSLWYPAWVRVIEGLNYAECTIQVVVFLCRGKIYITYPEETILQDELQKNGFGVAIVIENLQPCSNSNS